MAWTMVAVMDQCSDSAAPSIRYLWCSSPWRPYHLTAALSVESRYVPPSDPAPGFALHAILALLALTRVLTLAAAQSLFPPPRKSAPFGDAGERWVLKAPLAYRPWKRSFSNA